MRRAPSSSAQSDAGLKPDQDAQTQTAHVMFTDGGCFDIPVKTNLLDTLSLMRRFVETVNLC